ncbi:MAG: hypothetical protein ACFBSE_26830 [Prochloraceae cyanobacterium]
MFAQLLGIPTFIVSKQVVVDFYSETDRLNYLRFVAQRLPRLYDWIVALSYAISLKNKREVWGLLQVGVTEFGSDLIKEAYQCVLDSISSEEIDWLCDNLDGLLAVFEG